MARIQNYFERRFRQLLTRLGVPNVDQRLDIILSASHALAPREHIPMSLALAKIHVQLCRRTGARAFLPRHFVCDAGLGGLSRWLRAAGYDAVWYPDIDDAEVIRQAQRREATLLTTDTLMMERGILRDGVVPAIWLPPTVGIAEQLALVFGEMGLELGTPRCMKCGGELRAVSKEEVAPRIPPKTFRWRDNYYLCNRCDQLFWLGTHWGKIRQRLQHLADAEPIKISLPLWEDAPGRK